MLRTCPEDCLACGACIPLCSVEALVLPSTGIVCDNQRCVDCGDCVSFCPVDALELVVA